MNPTRTQPPLSTNAALQSPAQSRIAAWTLSLAASPAAAWAHPGHGLQGVHPAHFLTSPDHVALLGGASVALLATARWASRPASRRAIRALGTAGAVASVAAWIRGL